MGYRLVDADSVPTVEDRPCRMRRLSDPADLSNVAVNRFEAAPGEQLPLAYHSHEEQEEFFYVLSGTLAVETPDGEFTVGTDELFAVDPGSPHRAHNPVDADGPVTVLAVGAPAVSGDAVPYDPET
jgi:mannose-6-phosphate isomerase-like protein (cupin superfamily)